MSDLNQLETTLDQTRNLIQNLSILRYQYGFNSVENAAIEKMLNDLKIFELTIHGLYYLSESSTVVEAPKTLSIPSISLEGLGRPVSSPREHR